MSIFSSKKDLLAARLCGLSYVRNDDKSPNTDKILRMSKEFKSFQDCLGFDYIGSQAIMLIDKYDCHVVFRGSDQDSDWKRNFDFKMINSRIGKVHKGFYLATRAISEQIIREIPNDKRLHIAGHSLGGAMAVIFAAILMQRSIIFDTIHTFGQPRVFGVSTGIKFNAETRNRYFRYQNNNDIVCHAPPSFLGYKHTGMLRYIDRYGRIRKFIPFFDKILGSVLALREKGIDFTEDHDIKRYINALK